MTKFTTVLQEVLNMNGALRLKTKSKKFDARNRPARQELQLINESVKLRQEILVEPLLARKIELIRIYLKNELKLWADLF